MTSSSENKTKCPHDPRNTTGAIGMYHCPECGEMVIAGMDHVNYDDLIDRIDEEGHKRAIEWVLAGAKQE